MFGAATAAFPQAPTVSGCSVFPADNVWNTKVDQLPVDSSSATYVNNIGATKPLLPNFYSNSGETMNYVKGTQAKVAVTFSSAWESDKGPYPIPSNVVIEPEGDHHAFILDTTNCIEYELYDLVKQSNGTWHAVSGAIFHLNSDALRPAGWTSADAAGLAMLPGFVRYDEILAGHINHAIRFTAPRSRYNYYLWPARHWASSVQGTQYPPFGQRFRLKASFNISGFSAHMQVVLQALKTYGMILADNGSAWNIDGLKDARLNGSEVNSLKNVIGADFEAVNETSLMENTSSAQVKGVALPQTVATGWVNIVSKNSGLCLSVVGGSEAKASGVALEQATCVNGTHQEFQFIKASGGYEMQVRSSGLAVDVFEGSVANGGLIQQYTYHATTNQLWNMIKTADGDFEIVSDKSGKCLDVSGGSKADHAKVIQYTWANTDNQKWSFVPAE